MSSVAPPSPPADAPVPEPPQRAEPAAASAPAPTRPQRRHPWRDRVSHLRPPGTVRRPSAELVTTLGVALVLAGSAFSAGGGGSLGPSARTEIALQLIGAALVVAALLTAPRAAKLHGALPVALLAVFAAFSALSIAWAVAPADAWLVANRLFAYLAAFAGAVALARMAPHRHAAVLGGVVLALGVVCGYALLTKALPRELNAFDLFARLREPFGYWNAVGLTGALAVAPCLWLGTRRAGSPALNALAYPALTVALAATLMAYSRGALLAAAIGTALWFALVPLRLRGAAVLGIGGAGALLVAVWSFGQAALTTDRAGLGDRAAAGGELLVLLVAVLALVYVAGIAANFAADLTPLQRRMRRRVGIGLLVCVALAPVAAAGALATTDEGLGGSIDNAWTSLTDVRAVGPANDPGRLTATGSVRSRYWSEGFRMWEAEKAVGLGAGGYATARPRYRQDLLDVRHAHGFIPETMAELGLVGLLLALALLATWIAAVRRALRAARGSERAALVTLTAVALTFGVHSTIDWTWAVPGVALVALACAGFVAGWGPRGAPGPASARRPSRDRGRLLAAAAVGLIALAAVWSTWQPVSAVDAADDALAAMSAGRLDEAREHAERARDRNPLSVEPLLDLAAIENRAGRRGEAEDALEEAVELQPASWLPWMRLADFRLFELKEPDRAFDAVRVAIFLNPRSWDVSQRYLDVRRAMRAGQR